MSILRQELTFEGGVNIESDPHLLKTNEWLQLQNMWPYKSKLLGSRPSLLHEMDILPVPQSVWNGNLRFLPTKAGDPPGVKHYYSWFRYLTPLKSIFLGSLEKMALICVCTYSDKITISEKFEGEDETQVLLQAGDVILMLTPNNLQDGSLLVEPWPIISAVRLGSYSNITPSLIDFNGEVIAANKGCNYVVRVVKASTLPLPSPTYWPNIDYRFTKVDFGASNIGFNPESVIVYKNRFVYSKANKIWFSDPFEPGKIYANAEQTAYLGIFFDTGLTEDITAMTDLYVTSLDEAGSSVLAVWTQHSMLMVQGEPATTIASTPQELFADCKVTRIPMSSGCISQASVVKTKYGLIWCGAESVWFMARGNLPIEVGLKISPRIQDQSFSSAGRIFATFDEECYRLVINQPGVGFNSYDALNEMWCLSFIGGLPSKENAAWFGPQTFTNSDNQVTQGTMAIGGNPGVFCCAKLTNVNDDKTWYIQPYAVFLGFGTRDPADNFATGLSLASISTYLGVDITAPFRINAPIQQDYYYDIGAVYSSALGDIGSLYPCVVDFVVTTAGIPSAFISVAVYVDENGNPCRVKRLLESDAANASPRPFKIGLQSGNLTLGNPELIKLISGYELTYKTLNPIAISNWWWPWEPVTDPTNVVVLESKSNVPATPQNVLGGLFNEPVLTARRIPAPSTKRYNGLTAQLNVTEPDAYRIITSNNNLVNPNWNKIKISYNGIEWTEFVLFDFDTNGIAHYSTMDELFAILVEKTITEIGLELESGEASDGTIGLKFVGGADLWIDLTAQGWEWFGYVPTNSDYLGYGTNIITNTNDPFSFIPVTGPRPFYTPHQIHVAKLAVRYKTFEARPR